MKAGGLGRQLLVSKENKHSDELTRDGSLFVYENGRIDCGMARLAGPLGGTPARPDIGRSDVFIR